MSSQQKPQIIHTELVAKSRLFRVEQVHLKFSNGVERVYERMQGGSRGAVMVVPMLDEHTVLLVKEYAVGTETYELGFVKGLIDPGEDALQAANRELQEEAGFQAERLTPLMEVALAPGYFSSKMNILLAQGLTPSKLEGDEPEPLELVPWPIADLDGLLARADFSESRAISALFLARKALKLS
ncbi:MULTISPECIES: ADP compounds hydrolase NudE [Ferrimonas]|uniref:ADP compounds hydrolase NudE n=1 Tax=Ferrimonas TaxID=44011 RepID=UPI0003FEDD4A|nr:MULTISPECIES: ADP compounds hydrolase NudE [Ferrimonas]USD37811.1 ADP compounds hydrolase NudE [Ferrimonas sp. SCSIO 43195]